MRFCSTRDTAVSVSAAEAIAKGLSADGGLFVPESFPQVSFEELTAMVEMTYEQRADLVLSKYLTDFTAEELSLCTSAAYARFDGDPAPVVKVDDGLFILELWHGPTLAFKDMALTLLPHLLTVSRKKVGIEEDILILVATSGDTGKAALEGFRDVDGTRIIVFYPSDGVSAMQKLQMTTQEGNNVFVAAVNGNFDDCQSAVKRIFSDREFGSKLKEEGVVLSSANSINFGRLVPQIVYYFSAYCDLVDAGEIEMGADVDFCVPTGNFGNILAGYYAKRMGLPVGRLICASNKNKVLTDFFTTGIYDVHRTFHKTISPSMDILISSNLERLIFELSGRDASLTAKRMDDLKKHGHYSVTKEELCQYAETFSADFSDEESTKDTIGGFFDDFGYPLDPHTAVAVNVADAYNLGVNPMVIVSTASPYKFASDVLAAITEEKSPEDPFRSAKLLEEETAMPIPPQISELKTAKIRFDGVFEADALFDVVANNVKKA